MSFSPTYATGDDLGNIADWFLDAGDGQFVDIGTGERRFFVRWGGAWRVLDAKEWVAMHAQRPAEGEITHDAMMRWVNKRFAEEVA